MQLSAAARTHVGLRRAANEDAYALAPELGLFLVADGMGGHLGGQLASELAAESTLNAARKVADASATLPEKLRYCVTAANREIFLTAQKKPELTGMGTTLVAVLAAGGRVGLAHVGDSRAYLVRGDRARQLTDDHSLVADLVRRQELSAVAARGHPHRHVLTRALGVRRSIEPDLAEFTPEPGDVLALCTDGLTEHVHDEEIARVVSSEPALEAACERLVDLANDRGGEDNITVALLRWAALTPAGKD